MTLLNSIADAVLNLSAPELIGAILFALLVSAGTAGLFSLVRRKAADPTILVTCLVLVANLASMALAAGYVLRPEGRSRGRAEPQPPRAVDPRGRRGVGLEQYLAARIMAMADANNDGVLSPEEAADAAGRFTRDSGEGAGKSIDAGALAEAMRVALFPPRRPDPVIPGPVVAPIPDPAR